MTWLTKWKKSKNSKRLKGKITKIEHFAYHCLPEHHKNHWNVRVSEPPLKLNLVYQFPGCDML